MQITLFSFDKRSNSTATPSGTGTSVTATLKDSTSIYSPSFLLTGHSLIDYNYVQWDSRYYFITDTIYTNSLNLIEIRCNIDVLATYKSEIQSTSAFVAYSTSNYDTQIPDTRLSMAMTPTISTNTGTCSSFSTTGCYIVSFIGHVGSSQGVCTVRLSASELATIQTKLMDTNLLDDLLADVSDYTSKKINNASDCITGAIWIPLLPWANNLKLYLGASYDTGVYAGVIDHDNSDSVSLTIPWQFSDFRNKAPYTSLQIYLPGYGIAELNPEDFIGQSTLTVNINFDPYNGGLTYRIGTLYKFDCNVAVAVPVGTVNNNVMGTVAGAVGTVLGAVTGNVAAAAVSLFHTATAANTRTVGSVGGNGGGNSFNTYTSLALTTITHDTTVTPASVSAVMGRPLNQIISLSGLSGYVQTVDASVSIAAPDYIINDVNNLLNGGVFLE